MKEAALDSPTFRATSLHFSDNIDAVERWLEGYVKAAARLVADVAALEATVNQFLGQSTPPAQISEAVLDHDYTLLAMRRYGEGTRDFWQSTLRGAKRYDSAVVDPIKSFLNNDLRTFKDARRALDSAQKGFDAVITRYLAQSKTKESSSLREDAFQLHEARKIYLKCSMDFAVQAPQLRASLDRLLVKIFSEQWKEMRASREASAATFTKWSGEMERVRGWSREMENSERAFKRELLSARRQIEDTAENMFRPSRELEDYAASTVPYLGTGATSAVGTGKATQERSEKQGWLLLRTVTGKPARTVWSRRWFFVKNGIFGWLVQGMRSGGVEESERTGVLLCSVRPAFQEERRFCLEVKTKDSSIILQAETQQELTEWISAFEMAKRKALENPASTEASNGTPGIDPAFAVSQPSAPEFAAKIGEGHLPQGSEEAGLTVPEREGTGLSTRASVDINPSRRVLSLEKEPEGVRESIREGTRDHAARIIQKLDLHKRSTASPQLSQAPAPGGIASLISASHNILPVGPGSPPQPVIQEGVKRNFTLPTGIVPTSIPTTTLAPSTLVNPPAATNLSHTAVVVGGERGISLGRADGSGMPSGILANLWGSSNWGYVNRLGDELKPRKAISQPNSPALQAATVSQDDSIVMEPTADPLQHSTSLTTDIDASPGHRKTYSVGPAALAVKAAAAVEDGADEYPSYYPLPLKAQNAQFHMLFPTVPRSEKVVLVFRATWNPNEQQEFPGRVYVTETEIYFFSNHLGLVLITGVSLSSISEVTAAPGRDCDFLYLHVAEDSTRVGDVRRTTIKVFLEPLRLLQRRLNLLIRNAEAESPAPLEDLIKTLIKMEVDQPQRSSSVDSWEEVAHETEHNKSGDPSTPQRSQSRSIKASLRIDGNLYGETAKTGREIQRFKLPAQPVRYAPQGMQANIARDFNVSAKALFHVMFGDKSAVFQLLNCNRWSTIIVQTSWTKSPIGGQWMRTFSNQAHSTDTSPPAADVQTIDIFNDHLCYVITNVKQPHRLPYASQFVLTTKIVITHTAKSRCKLAIFQNLVWRKEPKLGYIKHLIERQAYNSLEADALDLSTVAQDQVSKLGSHSKTNKAVDIFGSIGLQTTPQAVQIDGTQLPNLGKSLEAVKAGQAAPSSLGALVINDVFARALGAVSMVFDVFVALGKGVVALWSAHMFLVVILAISGLWNGWHSWRDGVGWWRERGTTKFMNRIGVGSEMQLSKAVWLRDIEELVRPPHVVNESMSVMLDGKRSCRTTFGEQLALSSSVSVGEDPPGMKRLRLSRETMARRRHDLMVALRVVNRIERGVVLAEWEEWVKGEERKCRQVEGMLRLRDETGGPAKSEAELDGELGDSFRDYCSSCRTEMAEFGSENGEGWLLT